MKKKNWHLCHLCPSGLTTLSSSKIDAPRRYTTLTMWIQISPAWISAWILFEKHRLAAECHVVHPIKLNSASKREKRRERRESKVCDSVYHSTEDGSSPQRGLVRRTSLPNEVNKLIFMGSHLSWRRKILLLGDDCL
uniref:uncharacterized protein LOC106999016 isoform X1 n=1 Tax=Macaca mulatta TaxID=9544 RepID=UPI0010A26C83|nr:uncharacterized protein LOC106999016 isoform X1 [Macaca mulatta]